MPGLVDGPSWAKYGTHVEENRSTFELVLAAMKPLCIVELGVATGGSLAMICDICDGLGYHPKVYGIDVDVTREARERLGSRAELIKSRSDSCGLFIRPDFVHVDADHSYWACLKDYLMWFAVLNAPGAMMFHDVNPEVGQGSAEVWQLIEQRHPGKTWMDTRGCGEGVLLK